LLASQTLLFFTMDFVIAVTGLGEIAIGNLVAAVHAEAFRMLAAVRRLRLVVDRGVVGDRQIWDRFAEEVHGWWERSDVAFAGFWAAEAAADAGGEAVTEATTAVWSVAQLGTDVWWLTFRAVVLERQAVAAGGLAAAERVTAAELAARLAEAAERRIMGAPSPHREGERWQRYGGRGTVAAGGGGMGVTMPAAGGSQPQAAVEEVNDWWRPMRHGPRCLFCGPLSLTGTVPLSPVFPEASFLE